MATKNGGLELVRDGIFVSLKDATPTDVASIGNVGASQFLRIDVRDTGKGISKEEADKIFERFFQAKGAASGTGIGLALVKSFVDLHHGWARVESELGEGSDFIVVIPRQQEANGQVIHNEVDHVDNSVSTSASDGTNVVNEAVLQYIDDGNKQGGKLQQVISEHTNQPTLLIIDDNNDIRQYERTLLQDAYFILEASDGKEGLEIAKKEVPDLVICDVMMPVMDGLEFTEQLKTYTATSHIPVIMLTAKNLEEQRAEGYEHGAFSVEEIGKQIGLSRVQLYRKVKAMTGSSVVDLIRKARLAKARRLLESRSMSISEVAYEVGFSAPSYFTKCFKVEYGILPGDVNA